MYKMHLQGRNTVLVRLAVYNINHIDPHFWFKILRSSIVLITRL